MTLRVLYIDGVGPFGGASRSLYEAIRAFPGQTVQPCFVAQRGTALDFYGKVSDEIASTRGLTRFDNSRYSHYRGVRWLVLLREFGYVPYTIAALARARRLWRRVDLVHQNEVMEILPGILAKRLFNVPLVVHVRSMQDTRPTLRTRWVHHLLRRYADAVIAIDQTVRGTLPSDLQVDVIHNSFSPSRSLVPDSVLSKRLASLRPDSLKVGFVGNLHHSKGIFDLLDAAAIVRDRGEAVDYLVVGGNTNADRGSKARLLQWLGLAQNVGAELVERVTNMRLSDSFHLIGPTHDIQSVYETIDVIAFPSHFDAPGRPVFEAAFSAKPAIVSMENPRPDTLVHNQTGLAIPAHSPERLAEAILHFAANRAEVRRMGFHAQELAHANFLPAPNAKKLRDLYERVVKFRVSR